MSRTYHHGYKAKERLYGDNLRWYSNSYANRAWKRAHKHTPQRAACRRAIREVMQTAGISSCDSVSDCPTIFPHDKKPIHYYW